jgi:hypothetical protein
VSGQNLVSTSAAIFNDMPPPITPLGPPPSPAALASASNTPLPSIVPKAELRDVEFAATNVIMRALEFLSRDAADANAAQQQPQQAVSNDSLFFYKYSTILTNMLSRHVTGTSSPEMRTNVIRAFGHLLNATGATRDQIIKMGFHPDPSLRAAFLDVLEFSVSLLSEAGQRGKEPSLSPNQVIVKALFEDDSKSFSIILALMEVCNRHMVDPLVTSVLVLARQR